MLSSAYDHVKLYSRLPVVSTQVSPCVWRQQLQKFPEHSYLLPAATHGSSWPPLLLGPRSRQLPAGSPLFSVALPHRVSLRSRCLPRSQVLPRSQQCWPQRRQWLGADFVVRFGWAGPTGGFSVVSPKRAIFGPLTVVSESSVHSGWVLRRSSTASRDQVTTWSMAETDLSAQLDTNLDFLRISFLTPLSVHISLFDLH